MTDNTSNPAPSVFHDGDEFVDTGYRRVTLWAIAALLAGIGSFAALVAPLLWVVPLVAIGCGWAALRAIRLQDEVLGGRKLAVVGMFLGSLALAWCLSSYFVHMQLAYAYARVHANTWFELLKAKRLHEAHQLRRDYADRVEPTADLEKYYAMYESQEMFNGFLREPVVAKILQLGQDARFTFLGHAYITKDSATIDLVGLRYRLESASGSEPPVEFELELSREYFSGTRESRWAIRRADFIAPGK